MKLKLAIVVGIFSLFISGYSFAGCDGYSANTCVAHNNNCSSSECECTDPYCDRANDCLSSERCCRSFGNIGRN